MRKADIADIAKIADIVAGQMQSGSRENKNIEYNSKQQATVSSESISLALAKRIAAKVEQKAAEIGVNAVISICGAGARPVLTECMDDSYIASFDIAFNKAFTSVSLKMSTVKLKSLSQPHGSLYGIQNTNDGKIVVFGGGEPLLYGGRIIGGLGVSGGSEEQDTLLAKFGAECAKAELSKFGE